MTITNVTAVQTSNTQVQVSWTTDAALPATWDIRREIDDGGMAARADLREQTALVYFDPIDIAVLVPGTDLTYRVTDPLNVVDADSNRITLTDLSVNDGYGPVDPLETEPRYTTVPIVKDAMGIETGVTQFDAAITTAIVTIEYLIDAYLEHSFPDPATPPDTEPVEPPPIEGIPIAVTQAATLGAVKTVKLTDMPFGVGGSDDFIGTVDFAPGARRAFNEVMPLLLGFKRAWGVA